MVKPDMTPRMSANELAHVFNGATARENWKAQVGGTRNMPTVIFKNRSSLVELTYYETDNVFTVRFTKTICCFGDFMGAIARSLVTVLTAMKSAGLPVSVPVDPATGFVRIQYDQKTKTPYVSLADVGDDWQKTELTIKST